MLSMVHNVHASELNKSPLYDIMERWTLDDLAQYLKILDRYAAQRKS